MNYEILLFVPGEKTMILRYDTIEQARLACKNVTGANLTTPDSYPVTATPLNFTLEKKTA